MIVHEVKIGKSSAESKFTGRHRTVYVGSAETDLKYRDMLVFFRHRWELYTNGYLDLITCDRDGLTEKQWKQKAEEKIMHSNGVMILVSENTATDETALWQIDCAFSNNVPIVGVDIRDRFEGEIPGKLNGKMTKYGWEWFARFINQL